MNIAQRPLAAVAFAMGCTAAPIHAASIYLSPAASTVDIGAGTASFDLLMDFATSDATLGGGVDLDVSGVASFASFMPSTYFATAADPAFSGFGTAHADADYEIHIGNFNGLSGQNNLGTLTLAFSGPGAARIGLAINSFYGDFYSAVTLTKQNVDLIGAGLTVTAVPEPQALMLMLAGLGAVACAARVARRAG